MRLLKMNKICTKCKKEYPATLKYFSPDKRNRNGLQSRCRKCSRKIILKWQQSERGKILHERSMKKYHSTLNGYLRCIYGGIKARCNSSKHVHYSRYGGRGIKCLFASLDNFRDYVINTLEVDPRGLQIDRINNDGNYEPGNIRFVTAKVNSNNRGIRNE